MAQTLIFPSATLIAYPDFGERVDEYCSFPSQRSHVDGDLITLESDDRSGMSELVLCEELRRLGIAYDYTNHCAGDDCQPVTYYWRPGFDTAKVSMPPQLDLQDVRCLLGMLGEAPQPDEPNASRVMTFLKASNYVTIEEYIATRRAA